MDPFAAFFSAQFLFFCLAIFAITFIIRTILEYAWKKAVASDIWNHLILPLLPVVLGGVGSAISTMYPNPLGTSFGTREVFGLVAGLCSGLVYKMLKGYVKSKLPLPSITTSATTAVSTTATAPDNSTVTTNTSQTTQVSGMSGDVYPKS